MAGRSGFALVATLSLMILLAILAVGLLSLATVSLRAASSGAAAAEARANARLALILAVGEIQKSLGRDEAITSPAAILDSNPDTPEPDGVRDPHLTGIWAARTEALGTRPDYDRSAPFRRWLVSNADPRAAESLELARSGSLSEPVVMVNLPVPAGDSPRREVRAGRVKTEAGAYAWWVGDENCKARVGFADEFDRAGMPAVADLLAGFATPGGHGIRAVPGFGDFPSNTPVSDRLITHSTIGLADADGGRPAEFFHDLTPYSESVLADVTRGSLRQDLSLYLERQDINWLDGWGWPGGKSRPPAVPRGPNGAYALSLPAEYDVLSWKSLHHWQNMHRRQLKTSPHMPLVAMRNYTALDPVHNAAWNSGVMRISPVLARMQMIVSYGVRKTGPGAVRGTFNYDLFMYSYPVLTLWNPYSVGLEVEQWSVFLHTLPLEHAVYRNGTKINLSGGGTRNGNYNWGWPHGNMVMRFGDAGTPGITFAPGEAKVLTYAASQSGGFHAHDMVAGIRPWLPPTAANPQGQAGQARHLGTITGADTDRIEIETTGSSWNTSAASYSSFQTTFCYRCESKAVHRGHPEDLRRQMFTSQVAWRVEADAGNPSIDFISRSNFPSMTLGQLDNAPSPFLHLDVRLKTLDEVRLPNKTWLHNIPHHPYAAATSTQKHREVDAATNFFAHPYTVSFEQINGIEGLVQNRPFFGPSNSPSGRGTIIAQDIPLAPLTSLAQLQNLPQVPIEALNWSGYYFQNQAIGNSFASPGLPPQEIKQRSFPFYLGEYFPWQGGDLAGNFYPDWTWFNNDHYTIPHAPASIIDRSYAANHLLFDSYFFSSLAAQQGPIFKSHGRERPVRQVLQEFFEGTRPAPNAAYRPYLGRSDPAAILQTLASSRLGVTADAHRLVAAHLTAAGGFNVNSTSVPAWTALLASAHLKRPVTFNSRGSLLARDPARFVVSRFSAPVGGPADGQAASEENRWLGYRELTGTEVSELAEAIVKQVKLRGPFRSLGEFVNRRLTNDTDLALYGAVQAALEDPSVSINHAYRGDRITASDLTKRAYAANYSFPEAALGPRHQGTPAYISQADILTPVAPILNARSDTFLIRGYGEARSADGQAVTARAWCEAVIQRVPDYIDHADSAHTAASDLKSSANRNFGRRFLVKSFRWVPASEIESPGKPI
ncbi:MAG: hypothetical protein ACO3JG_00005 [Luteolibacter sp.]